ncbi:MAG TPA: hypothetical protein VFR31_00140 [Thermoanaerobaculia bacterium]|nr:hypothetical protein [Thermoanaerobaculia bacterium]
MNTNKSKPLAKVFGPVLLLSAALSLPVDSYAAPAKERNAQSQRADKQERKANRAETQKQQKKQSQKQEARNNNNRGDEQRAAAHRQAEINRQRAAERKAAAQRQADLNRQRAAERKATNQRAEARRAETQRLQQQFEQNRRERQLRESRQAELNRRAQLQRQAELNRQRQVELNRRAELQRQADLQRRYNNQRYAAPRDQFGKQYYGTRWFDRSNNRYRSYAGGRSWSRGDTIAVDGYLTDEGYSCQALRDDNGDLYMLVNHTYGLRTGDHARVVGRVVDGGYCDWEGIAFEITDVTALWADRRHQAVYYHQNYDGGQFGDRDNWIGRRPRQFQNRVERFGYYDRDANRYRDRYPN